MATSPRPSASRPPLVAAVDAGTTGARAVAFDPAGLVAEVRQPYRTRSPRPGWAEQDAHDWAESARSVLRRLAARTRRAGTISAIGLTGQCPTMVVADERGRPLRPGMLYRDNRAVDEAQQMRDRVGDAVMHQRTGHLPEAFHVGPQAALDTPERARGLRPDPPGPAAQGRGPAPADRAGRDR